MYGTVVPIGGGAICGSDPHKVDRCDELRARQAAKKLVRASGGADCLRTRDLPEADCQY